MDGPDGGVGSKKQYYDGWRAHWLGGEHIPTRERLTRDAKDPRIQ
jgi:hypothetical protein